MGTQNQILERFTVSSKRRQSREKRGMKMLCKFKPVSRAVHEEQQGEDKKKKEYPRTEARLGKSLTVWRKSLVFSCEGFTVIDSDGNLVYRVDNYMGRPDEITLMDASGKSVFTMRRRRVSPTPSLSLPSFITFIYILYTKA